jgi:hypothetical protein
LNEERLEQIAREAWEHVPSFPAGEGRASNETYYDRPALKEPVWKWMIPAYFVAGGAAGAAAVLGAFANALDAEEMHGLVKRCRWISTGGTTLGTAFLIADLGKPERFLNMLRVFRPTSPMNVGSFILAPATGTATISALLCDSTGAIGAVGDLAGSVTGVLGVPLAGYTAVLVSNSAIPVWAAIGKTLPALFTASAVTAATSILDFTELNDAERKVVRRYGIVGRFGELAAGAAVENEARRVERVGKPLSEGVSGALWKASKACTAVGLALSLLPGRARWKRQVASFLGLAGSAGAKFAIWRAGFASARDPRATFEQQRAGRGGAEIL